MYRCRKCNAVVPSRTSMRLVILEKRQRQYPYRAKANRGYATNKGEIIRPLKKSRRASDRVDDLGGSGWEIAKAVPMCPGCANAFESSQEKDD